jgi:hypothetical protein
MPGSSYSVTVRFPSATEYWHSENVPVAGTRLWHGRREYRVVSCEHLAENVVVVNVAEVEVEVDTGRQPAIA